MCVCIIWCICIYIYVCVCVIIYYACMYVCNIICIYIFVYAHGLCVIQALCRIDNMQMDLECGNHGTGQERDGTNSILLMRSRPCTRGRGASWLKRHWSPKVQFPCRKNPQMGGPAMKHRQTKPVRNPWRFAEEQAWNHGLVWHLFLHSRPVLAGQAWMKRKCTLVQGPLACPSFGRWWHAWIQLRISEIHTGFDWICSLWTCCSLRNMRWNGAAILYMILELQGQQPSTNQHQPTRWLIATNVCQSAVLHLQTSALRSCLQAVSCFFLALLDAQHLPGNRLAC